MDCYDADSGSDLLDDLVALPLNDGAMPSSLSSDANVWALWSSDDDAEPPSPHATFSVPGLVSSDAFDQEHVTAFFDLRFLDAPDLDAPDTRLSVLACKHSRMKELLVEFEYMRDHGIVRFYFDGARNVFGFSSWRVVDRSTFDSRMLALALEFSPTAKVQPVTCIYEIVKYCGMEVQGRAMRSLADNKKRSLTQDVFVFNPAVFARNKHRAGPKGSYPAFRLRMQPGN